MAYIQLLGGLIYVLMGGDLLVRGAVALARRARVSPAVIAVSLVAFGTSLPELVVTLRAVLAGFPEIALGNVVGSNIANVLLVLGVPALAAPVATAGASARRDGAVMVAASGALFLVCLPGELGRLAGAGLLAGLGGWVWLTAREGARTRAEADLEAPLESVLGLPSSGWMIALFVGAGLVGLPLGARLFVEAAVDVARQLSISDAVAGLTIVAVGTSLPELGTTLMAALRRETDVAVGTALGSNILNILGILGASAVVSPVPIPVPPSFLSLDLPVMVAAALLIVFLVWRRRPLGRRVGAGLLVGYVAYLWVLLGA